MFFVVYNRTVDKDVVETHQEYVSLVSRLIFPFGARSGRGKKKMMKDQLTIHDQS